MKVEKTPHRSLGPLEQGDACSGSCMQVQKWQEQESCSGSDSESDESGTGRGTG